MPPNPKPDYIMYGVLSTPLKTPTEQKSRLKILYTVCLQQYTFKLLSSLEVLLYLSAKAVDHL